MNSPYRQLVVGQSVRSLGQLSRYMDGYYPNSMNKLVIEEANDDGYKVRPMGTDDIIEAKYFDLMPNNLVRSHFFVPCEQVKIGVAVRRLNNTQSMVQESEDGSVLLNDGTILNGEIVEIMKFEDDPNDIFYFLREE